jgi:hypothetical protein
MSYTIIPDLPAGGSSNGYLINVTKNLLVVEQDITRKVTPLTFLSDGIAQLTITEEHLQGENLVPIVTNSGGIKNTQNLTINNLMNYINTHLNVIDEVFFVSSLSGVDSLDYDERGRNEQLPFRTIKFAAQQIAKKIQAEKNGNYNPLDPNYVADNPSETPVNNSRGVRRQYTIMVRSGDYVEENPVYLPPNTSMIGDNLRRTTIRPIRPQLDMFWLDSANYIWGFTFRDHKAPAAATAFPISKPVWEKSQANITLPDNTNTRDILKQYAPEVGDGSNGTYVPTAGNTPSYPGWVNDSYYYAYLMPLSDDELKTAEQAINDDVIPQKRPYIYTSPYVQGCTSYAVSDRMPSKYVLDNRNNPVYPQTWVLDDGNDTPCGPGSAYAISVGKSDVGVPPPNNAGMGMRIDGSLVDGFIRSMVIDSFTQVNQGGKGIYLLNHGYAQFVSTFTVATEQGIVCEAGATCSISTSNSTFGLSGLVARGMSYRPVLFGKFVIPDTLNQEISGQGTYWAYPLSSKSFANRNTYGVYGYSAGNNLFTINTTSPVAVNYPSDPCDDISHQTGSITLPMFVASQPYATLCFTVGDDKPWIVGYHDALKTLPIYSGPGYIMEEDINPTLIRTWGESLPETLNTPASSNRMHQVKLFYIEQGAPTPSLSGGSTLKDSTLNYDIYGQLTDVDGLGNVPTGLTSPLDYFADTGDAIGLAKRFPTIGLPWDIQLSFNMSLDLKNKDATQIKAYDGNGTPLHFLCDYLGKPKQINYNNFVNGSTFLPVASGTVGAQAEYINSIPGGNGTIDFTNAPVKFYARSVAETGSHTFEYMGTGTRMKYAIPAFGGVTQNGNEAISDGFLDKYGNAPGIVFFTSSNELGNFKVGTDFTIVQSTGTIEGVTFSRAILTLVTPLNIVLE